MARYIEVAALQHGRGTSKTLLLVRGGRWLARVRYSRKTKRWLVSAGGALALDRIVGNKSAFDEAEYLAWQIVAAWLKRSVYTP